MRHSNIVRADRRRRLITSRRVQFLGALLLAALLPYLFRAATVELGAIQPASINALLLNIAAVSVAMWIRLSITTYPGIHASAGIVPIALTAHALALVFFIATRLPYDRVALGASLGIHILWNYAVYFLAERRQRPRIGIVPYGHVERLTDIESVEWTVLRQPRLEDALECDSIVADFTADMPDEWEAFLADAALAGRIVYQRAQLTESLTGKVQLSHLSENSFGSLVPARGYFHLKAVADISLAVLVIPIALPVMALIAAAIRLHDGGPALYRQKRVGHAGRDFTVYKFRTMRIGADKGEDRSAAVTNENDGRVTRVGAVLRKYRIDELPQVFNILKGEMSWIGPRPEVGVLSEGYTAHLPFYRYRHVVKPGISGWAQINQGHVAEVDEVDLKLQYDFYYIKYFSPWLDILIALRTVGTMVTGFGSK